MSPSKTISRLLSLLPNLILLSVYGISQKLETNPQKVVFCLWVRLILWVKVWRGSRRVNSWCLLSRAFRNRGGRRCCRGWRRWLHCVILQTSLQNLLHIQYLCACKHTHSEQNNAWGPPSCAVSPSSLVRLSWICLAVLKRTFPGLGFRRWRRSVLSDFPPSGSTTQLWSG